MKMSTESKELYNLLNDSCEQMFLYYQELAFRLKFDMDEMAETLQSLFDKTEVNLTDADDHQDGKILSDEEKESLKSKIERFKSLAREDSRYQAFVEKYGNRAGKSLLNAMVSRFTSNPEAIGADDYEALVKYLFESNCSLQVDLLSKYSKVEEVVRHISARIMEEGDVQEIGKEFKRISDEIAASHRVSSATQARYLNFLTGKDKESIEETSLYNVIEFQFNSCFNAFFQEQLQLPTKPKSDSISEQRGVDLSEQVEKDLDLFKACKKSELAKVDSSHDPNEYNLGIIELTILEGKLSFEKAIPGQEVKVPITVSSIMGCDTANSDVLEKLALADKLQNAVQGLRAEGLSVTLSNLSLRYRLSEGQINDENAAKILDDLIKLKKEELPNITARSSAKEVSLYNQIALELAILEGKLTFERAIIGQQGKKSTNVDSVIGSNTVGKSALEKLTTANKSGELQRATLEAQIKAIDQELKEMDNRNSQAGDLLALRSALFSGNRVFLKTIVGQNGKKRTPVASIIGRDSEDKSPLEKLEVLDLLSRLENDLLSRSKPVTLYHLYLRSRLLYGRVSEKELAELIALKEEELQLITDQNSEEMNQARLELAVLKNQKTVEIMMNGEMQKQKVSSILGVDPSKMTSLQRLEAVGNIDVLLARQEAKLMTRALKWIDDRMEKRANKLKKKHSTKAEKEYEAFAKLGAVVAGDSEYVRSPNPGPDGEAQVNQIPETEGNGKKQKIKLFKEHFEKHKSVLASKAVSAWATFMEVVTHLPRMNVGIDGIANLSNLSVKQKPMSQSSSNVANAPSQSRLRGSKSSPNLINDISQQSDSSNFGKSKSSPSIVSNIPPQPDIPALKKDKKLTFSKLSSRSFLSPPRLVVKESTETTGVTPVSTPGGAPAA